MDIDIAAAKINKYATLESGDSLEIVERPNGGVSVVLADGQTSGKAAKVISSMVVRKVIGLLAEGVRDGAAARAASDYLFTERNGKVSACLNILSVDFQTDTIVIARNNPTPVYISRRGDIDIINVEAPSIGTNRNIRPSITEIRLELGLLIVIFTDGVIHAGEKLKQNVDISMIMKSYSESENPSAQEIADSILTEALRLDQGRPNDDMSVVVLKTSPANGSQIRKMSVHIPMPPIFRRT